MAGYRDTRQLIIDTLMGRPAGTEIQPEDHQAFALALNDYIRNVELNSGNAFIGFAQADTVPIQSDNGQCFYISTVPPSTNIVYANFIDSEGNPISVTTPSGKMAFVTLIWNTRSWDSQITIIETNWSQVLEDNIASGAVTGSKIAPNSISTSKIIDGTIQSTDLNPNAFDETLSTPGKIAPADVVGSKLTELERDLGKYAELPSVAMTAETTGKYINADGEFVDDADFNIAAIGAVVVGNTYELYMGSAANMKLGVALFVARIKTTTTSGTERIEYVPLFSAMSTDIPTSGYVCFEAMDAYSDVLVCYRADVPEAATLLVRRYGTKASIATQINNLRKKVDLKSFADGYYESMRVGTADNLTSKGDATEEVIMSRKAGGDNQIEDGSASIKRIKGYSVVMNQFLTLRKSDYRTDYGLTLHAEGNVISIAGQLPSQEIVDRDINVYLTQDKPIILNFVGEKFLISLTGENFKLVAFEGVTNVTDFAMITQVTNLSKPLSLAIRPAKWGIAVNENVNVRVINLTQMFGSGKEPSTPDDFAKRLGYSSINDVPYIPYNEGEIVSSFAEGIKTTGKNLWDEKFSLGNLNNSTGEEVASDLTIRSSYVPILSENKIYLFNGSKKTDISFDKVLFYKKDKTYNGVKQYVNSGELEPPKDTSYIRFVLRPSYGTTYNHDVCINVSDVSFNGNYEPYTERLRKWSETLKKYFPEGLKSVGSVNDEITPTKAVKKIGKIDLGTCNWGKTSANGKTYYHTKEAIPNRSENSYVITSCYTTENRYPSQIQESESIDRIIGYKGYFTGVELWVIDSRYDTPEAFAAAMSGVILYYILATPEETTYDELNLTEQVAEGGTEEAIITEGKASTPLRADIVYPIDAYNTIKANKANIGTLSSLNTASKTDLVSAINELAGKVAALEANATEVTNETTK